MCLRELFAQAAISSENLLAKVVATAPAIDQTPAQPIRWWLCHRASLEASHESEHAHNTRHIIGGDCPRVCQRGNRCCPSRKGAMDCWSAVLSRRSWGAIIRSTVLVLRPVFQHSNSRYMAAGIPLLGARLYRCLVAIWSPTIQPRGRAAIKLRRAPHFHVEAVKILRKNLCGPSRQPTATDCFRRNRRAAYATSEDSC